MHLALEPFPCSLIKSVYSGHVKHWRWFQAQKCHRGYGVVSIVTGHLRGLEQEGFLFGKESPVSVQSELKL